MKIYGGHDYYDCGMAYGRDPNAVLIRDKTTSMNTAQAGFSLMESGSLELVRRRGFKRDWSHQALAVAFCGVLYRGIRVFTIIPDEDHFLWTPEQVSKWIGQHPKDVHSIRANVPYDWRLRKQKDRVRMEELMVPSPITEEVKQYMIENRYAILVQREERGRSQEKLEINRSGLKEIGFAKALDPYTAYQELSMWVSGILGGVSPEIVTITDDKVLVENHGFDKHSFRSSSRVA